MCSWVSESLCRKGGNDEVREQEDIRRKVTGTETDVRKERRRDVSGKHRAKNNNYFSQMKLWSLRGQSAQ
jgi:hypothetical protein